jgi:hypothetical protein
MKGTAITFTLLLLATGFNQLCFARDGNLYANCAEESGVQQTARRVVDSFDSIDIQGSFSSVITCGNGYAIKITCDKNLLPYIATEVRSRKLFIFTEKSICTTKGINIFISVPDIRSVNASGSNDISIKGIDNQSISVSLDGAGDLNLSGRTNKFKANLAGSNHLQAKSLRSEKSSISIAGSSDASVYATEVLDVIISGVGGVMYYGNPKSISKNISGIGTVEAAE